MDRIMRQDLIVSDVFPSAIRDRLYKKRILDTDDDFNSDELPSMDFRTSAIIGKAPLADLFPNTTVVFADIVGFTAWSSAREPSQVFVLLETLYSSFDKIAYRQGVFKVETVGDCYVAAAGIPEPNEEHAVIASKFARSCLKAMKEITMQLEVSLGPDTSELDMRIGIHRYI
jgi:class 3 adenylate cyclase